MDVCVCVRVHTCACVNTQVCLCACFVPHIAFPCVWLPISLGCSGFTRHFGFLWVVDCLAKTANLAYTVLPTLPHPPSRHP